MIKNAHNLTAGPAAMLAKLRASASRARVLLRKLQRDSRAEKNWKTEFYDRMWCGAAAKLGAEVSDRQGVLLQIRRGSAFTLVFQNYTDLDGPATLRASGDKVFVHRLLAAEGLPTPDYLPFTLAHLDKARSFLEQCSPCVVKPASGTGAGAGVTTGVHTPRELQKAAVRAAGYCSELLAERQVAGKNLRLLFLDGRLLDAVERRPPTVIGDGSSTVAALIRRANQTRLQQGVKQAQVMLRWDLDMQQSLREQGLARRAVPALGQRIQLKTVINDNAAADNVSIVDEVCPEVVETARRAARIVGVRLAGVDLVTPDPSRPLADVNGVVLEVNTTPGLYIHQHNDDFSVAAKILEACLHKQATL